MTREKLSEIIRRLPLIRKAVVEGKTAVVSYVGHRKIILEITREVLIVANIINDIYNAEKNEWVRIMIRGIASGRSDIAIIKDLPIERNAYYIRKQKFFDKIFECCIFRQIVSYEEIIQTEIF